MNNHSSLVGTTLQSRYFIQEILGKGGFGVTYLAVDQQLAKKRLCVVKHLRPQSKEPRILKAATKLFGDEAHILQELGTNCKQIPELFAYFQENGEFYLVQEFIDGHDLSYEIAPGKKLNEEEVVELLKEILEVLVCVHDKGIIHRDIKPQNLIRRKQDGKIVLIDFGAVKQISILTVDARGETSFTAVVGTQGYMPSEQAINNAKLCSDIYAVGMIAIQALTGLNIHDIQPDPRTGEVIWRNNTNVGDTLAKIIDKMVRYHFIERYQSIDKVLKALNSPRLNPLLDDKYKILRTCLEIKDWKEADRATVNLMLRVAGREKQRYLDLESLENFPCEVLRTINDLWVKYSNGRFGFSIQASIWEEIVDGNPNPDWEMYEKFGERIGWRKPNERMWYGKNLIFDIDQAPKGHLPVGRFGNISLLKRVVGKFGGFGLERVKAISSKLSECGILE